MDSPGPPILHEVKLPGSGAGGKLEGLRHEPKLSLRHEVKLSEVQQQVRDGRLGLLCEKSQNWDIRALKRVPQHCKSWSVSYFYSEKISRPKTESVVLLQEKPTLYFSIPRKSPDMRPRPTLTDSLFREKLSIAEINIHPNGIVCLFILLLLLSMCQPPSLQLWTKPRQLNLLNTPPPQNEGQKMCSKCSCSLFPVDHPPPPYTLDPQPGVDKKLPYVKFWEFLGFLPPTSPSDPFPRALKKCAQENIHPNGIVCLFVLLLLLSVDRPPPPSKGGSQNIQDLFQFLLPCRPPLTPLHFRPSAWGRQKTPIC